MKNTKIQIALSGYPGRMATFLLDNLVKTTTVKVVGIFIKDDSKIDIYEKNIEKKIKNSFFVSSKKFFYKKYKKFDVLIDFTEPKSSIDYISLCSQYNKKIIVGTTGFSKKQKIFIEEISSNCLILLCPNFSIGIFVIKKIMKYFKIYKKELKSIKIIEKHSKNKKDSPSGTAIFLKKNICKKFGISERKISISSFRDHLQSSRHIIIISTKFEKICIYHKSKSNSAFLKGIKSAIIWIQKNKKFGIFNSFEFLE
ncbi:4-hydroxy-tetrahydrodipicolinate reductase [bacterium endosymbiont of Pedicinus badii]|uniref:4-hydroxy-tetrahydrodipicolinate reductase n=1 Tax=bacterium endosymbiont of Pedicinus badii TaxID=1719126 RepID=UPI0009BB9D28|nr:4-hydroxy-tetrahydrodipicolinate reductase [bacterium endosymbiont of Pedicinus badii]OQM34204.1 hypothetical protein AOQ89_02630 [bacterium endosymbiont of Pedicinus badii]